MLNLDCPQSETQLWHNLIAAALQERLNNMVIKIHSCVNAWSKFNFLILSILVAKQVFWGDR